MMYATDVDLYTAATNGESEKVVRYLAEGANVNCASAEGNNTPLHAAARSGHLQVVQVLLDQRASIDAVNNKNNTPLHLAALSGHLQVVQELLDRRASVDAVNNKNYTPLHLSALKGHLQVVQELLDHGASVDAVNNKNYTPLQLATQNSHEQVVAALLAARGAERSIALVQVHERAVELLLFRSSASLTSSSIDRSWCTRNRST